jgi:hypothetical protein
MADPVERMIKRDRTWQVWVGSTADLERIGRLVGKLLDRRRDSLVAEFQQEHPPPRDPTALEPGKYVPYGSYAAFARDRIRNIDAACALVTSLTDRNGDVTSGNFDAVLAEFDSRNYSEIALKGNFASNYRSSKDLLELHFRRDAATPGVCLHVGSTDQGWAKQALAEITEEIDKGRKWWGVLRTFGGAIFTMAVAAGLVALLSSLLLTVTAWSTPTELWVGVTATLFAGAITVTALRRQWLFPPIEVIGEGVTPRGLRVLVWTGGLLITSVIGVAINTIK